MGKKKEFITNSLQRINLSEIIYKTKFEIIIIQQIILKDIH